MIPTPEVLWAVQQKLQPNSTQLGESVMLLGILHTRKSVHVCRMHSSSACNVDLMMHTSSCGACMHTAQSHWCVVRGGSEWCGVRASSTVCMPAMSTIL